MKRGGQKEREPIIKMKEKPYQNQISESQTSENQILDNSISDDESSDKSSKSTKICLVRYEFLDLFGRTDFIWPSSFERMKLGNIRNRFYDTILMYNIFSNTKIQPKNLNTKF